MGRIKNIRRGREGAGITAGGRRGATGRQSYNIIRVSLL
jgi:hypothetical protein